MKQTVFLFDIDSVLVEPGGYRQAFWASLDYFIDLMGVETSRPHEDDLELLESLGITSEWDMLPICVSLILDRVYQLYPALNSIDDMDTLLRQMRQLQLPAIELRYRDFFIEMKDFLRNDVAPCDSILENYQQDGHGKKLFPYITNTALLNQVFEYSRDARKSRTTRVFQNYILGDRKFKDIYSTQALFPCEPMLMKYDQPILDATTRDVIVEMYGKDQIRLSVYTLRPSSPPREIEEKLYGYAPEAEMAVSLVGLPDIPMISYGRLLYLATVHQLRVENIIKPSPVQALSAILAALTKNELQSMEQAYQLIEDRLPLNGRQQNLSDILMPEYLDLHVFEDSARGMRAVLEAKEYLEQAGIQVDISLWGIASNHDKVNSLKSLNATVYDDINQAVHAAVSGLDK